MVDFAAGSGHLTSGPASSNDLNRDDYGSAAVPSPCVDICRLDARGLCIDCRRTIDEISEWPAASEARRREILRALKLRVPKS
jgi:uncharacterized protein